MSIEPPLGPQPILTRFSLLLALGCGFVEETVPSTSDVGGSSSEATPLPVQEVMERPVESIDKAPSRATLEFQGNPVFWTDDGLEVLGSATQLIGPKGIESAIIRPGIGPCGGQRLENKDRSVLALPTEFTLSTPPTAPSNSATVVEAAQWRMNEVLSQAESSASKDDSSTHVRSSSLKLGSVSKTRRTGAPPVYIVTGVRDCTAAVAVLDKNLRTVLDQAFYTDICEPMAVLPPTNLDDQEGREVVLYNPEFVAVLRLLETPGSIKIEPLKHWTCLQSDTTK